MLTPGVALVALLFWDFLWYMYAEWLIPDVALLISSEVWFLKIKLSMKESLFSKISEGLLHRRTYLYFAFDKAFKCG